MIETVARRFGNVTVIFLSVLILLGLYSFVQSREKQGAIPSILGFMFVSIVTGSMHPSLEPGDAVLARQVQPEELVPGDIIVYLNSDKNISVSRIMKATPFINQPALVIRGDAENKYGITSVEYSSILGKTMLRIPYGAYFARFARSTEGILFTVFFPFLFLIVRLVALFRNNKKKDAEKKRQQIKSRILIRGMEHK